MEIILIGLTVLLIVAFFVNNRDFMAPAVLFTASFFIASFVALAYSTRWDLQPDKLTIKVILLGGAEFVIVCMIIHVIITVTLSRHQNRVQNYREEIGYSWKWNVLILAQLFGIAYTIQSLRTLGGGSLSQAIYYYRLQSIFGDQAVYLPKLVAFFKYFSMAAGIYALYEIAKRYIFGHQVFTKGLIVFVLAGSNTLLLGARTELVNMIIGGIVCSYFIFRLKHNWKIKGNFKIVLLAALIGLALVLTFKSTAQLLGRTISISTSDYLAQYVGAEIKNLDLFIRSGRFPSQSSIWGSQTFINIIPTVSDVFHLSLPQYRLDLPYQMVNGFDLGNVYSIYYPFLYDFGFRGVIVCVAGVATISQVCYESVKSANIYSHVPYSYMIYGYIASTLILSFFSNKFFELLFSKSFIYMIIVWTFLNLFFYRSKWQKN